MPINLSKLINCKHTKDELSIFPPFSKYITNKFYYLFCYIFLIKTSNIN